MSSILTKEAGDLVNKVKTFNKFVYYLKAAQKITNLNVRHVYKCFAICSKILSEFPTQYEAKIVLNHPKCLDKAHIYGDIHYIFRNSILLIPGEFFVVEFSLVK